MPFLVLDISHSSRKSCCLYSYGGVDGLVHDTAEVSRVLFDSDVTVFTPERSPGVLDVPGSVALGVSSPTGEKDTVIELLTAIGGDNTTGVELP